MPRSDSLSFLLDPSFTSSVVDFEPRPGTQDQPNNSELDSASQHQTAESGGSQESSYCSQQHVGYEGSCSCLFDPFGVDAAADPQLAMERFVAELIFMQVRARLGSGFVFCPPSTCEDQPWLYMHSSRKYRYQKHIWNKSWNPSLQRAHPERHMLTAHDWQWLRSWSCGNWSPASKLVLFCH